MNQLLIIMASQTDFKQLSELKNLLNENSIKYKVEAISCHRDLKRLPKFLEKVKSQNYKVIIAVANSVSNLPAMVAGYLKDSLTTVIGVGLDNKGLNGIDSLLAVNTIPKGVPILNTGIGGVGLYNAGLAAIKIIKR